MLEFKLKGDDFAALAGDLISQGKALQFAATGDSMRPQIRSGDRLEIQPVVPEDIRTGDVLLVVFEGKSLLAHRVVRISREDNQRSFQIQGDAVLCADGWVGPGEVIGRVVSLERTGKVIRLDSLWRHIQAAGLVYLLRAYKRLRPGKS